MGAVRPAGSILDLKVDGMTAGRLLQWWRKKKKKSKRSYLDNFHSIPCFMCPHQDIVWHFKSISFFVCLNLCFTVALIGLSLNRSSGSHYFLQRVAHQTRRPPTAPLTTERVLWRHAARFLATPTIALIVIADTAVRVHVCIGQLFFFVRVHGVHGVHMCARSNHIAPRGPDDLFACLRSASGAGAQAI